MVVYYCHQQLKMKESQEKKHKNNFKITSISTKISICLNMMDSFFSIKDPITFMISTISGICIMLILMEYTFMPWPISSNCEKSTGLRWYFDGLSACSGNMMPFFTPCGLEEHLFVVRTPISLLATFSLCMFTVYIIKIEFMLINHTYTVKPV